MEQETFDKSGSRIDFGLADPETREFHDALSIIVNDDGSARLYRGEASVQITAFVIPVLRIMQALIILLDQTHTLDNLDPQSFPDQIDPSDTKAALDYIFRDID